MAIEMTPVSKVAIGDVCSTDGYRIIEIGPDVSGAQYRIVAGKGGDRKLGIFPPHTLLPIWKEGN